MLLVVAEDAEVSNAYAYSGANSAKIVTNDDFVKPLGNKTTGKWYMSFYVLYSGH